MATADPATFVLDLLLELAQVLQARVRPLIESDTLRRAVAVQLDPTEQPPAAFLTIPHYWAVYYHDGRGPVYPVNGKFLVWFQDIADDPRVVGGRLYPVRSADIRRLMLDPDEFQAMLDAGQIVIRRSVGPAPRHPFFEQLGRVAPKIAAPVVKKHASGFARAALSDVLRLRLTTRVVI